MEWIIGYILLENSPNTIYYMDFENILLCSSEVGYHLTLVFVMDFNGDQNVQVF